MNSFKINEKESGDCHSSPEHQLMLGHGNDHLIIVLKVYSDDLRSNPSSSKKVFPIMLEEREYKNSIASGRKGRFTIQNLIKYLVASH